MIKYLLALFLVLGVSSNGYCVPNNTMSISPSAEDTKTITASDENTRNNTVSTIFNAHSHTDITALGTIATGVWQGTPIGVAYGGSQIATAAGTADAITADYSPDVSLANLTLVAFVASAANATTTPTFAPDGLTAHTITKKGGSALVAGDIPAALAVCIVEYNSVNTRWELLNPATAARFKVGSFTRDVSLASGTQSITGVGYAPTAIIFFVAQDGVADPGSFGFDDGTLGNSVWDDGATVGNTWRVDANSSIHIISGGSTLIYEGVVSTMGADGFTITWTRTNTPAGTITIQYLALR